VEPHETPQWKLPSGAEVRASITRAADETLQALSGLQQSASAVVTEVGRGLRWIDEHREGIAGFFEDSKEHRDTAWRYVLDLVDPLTGMTVSMLLEAKRRYDPRFEDSAAEVIEQTFLEHQLQLEIRDAVAASDLSPAHKKQLMTGLRFAEDEEPELAVPLLIIPLEGAFWHLAVDREVVFRKQKKNGMQGKFFTHADRKQIDSIEKLVKLPDMNLDADLVHFAATLAYGGTGNDYRHGTATDGWRVRSMFLIAALLGWLDATSSFDARRAVRAAAVRGRKERSSGRGTPVASGD
jgi:hypothetical protein